MRIAVISYVGCYFSFYLLQITSLNHWRVGAIIREDLGIRNSNRKKEKAWMEANISLTYRKAVNDRTFCPNSFFWSMRFTMLATTVWAIAEGCQTLTLYANVVYYLAGSTDPAVAGPGAAHSNFQASVCFFCYAQGFLISSRRAAVSAGKLSADLEGSICCPGGLRDGTDPERYALGDAVFTPERCLFSFFSFFCGRGGKSSQTEVFIIGYTFH